MHHFSVFQLGLNSRGESNIIAAGNVTLRPAAFTSKQIPVKFLNYVLSSSHSENAKICMP